MDKIKDGGPAFPHIFRIGKGENQQDGTPAENSYQFIFNGMTLRDYAAIHDCGMDSDASHVYAAAFNSDPMPETGDRIGWAKWFAKADATLRYVRADAMIAAREVKP